MINEDLDIVNKVIQGDINSFGTIINQYEKGISKFIYNIVKNKELSEDICQEVFISAYYKLYSYNQEYRFSTWLYKIASNKCMDFFRKNKKSKEININIFNLYSKEATPESVIELKETKKNIEFFLHSLKELDRKILALKASENKFSFREISEILNMSESNVKKRYYNILDKYEAINCSEETFEKGGI
jgi:RNA polymerase sigma-70 factor (ECF subfamily)